MVEKAIGGDDERESAGASFPLADTDNAAMVVVGPCSAFHRERSKGVLATECSGLGHEQIRIRRMSKNPLAVVTKGIASIRVGADEIPVLAFRRTEAGVKSGDHVMDRCAADVSREHGIQRPSQLRGVPRVWHNDAHGLTGGVHTGVSSSSARGDHMHL